MCTFRLLDAWQSQTYPWTYFARASNFTKTLFDHVVDFGFQLYVLHWSTLTLLQLIEFEHSIRDHTRVLDGVRGHCDRRNMDEYAG